MIHLKSSDVQKLHTCIRELYSNLDKKALPSHIVSTTSKIIPSCVTSYATIRKQNQRIVYQGITSCREWGRLDAFGKHMHEHPILNFLHPDLLPPHRYRDEIEKAVQKRFPVLRQDQHYSAARISDALPDRQFRRLGIYNDFFRHNGVAYQMLLSFLPHGNGYSMISFNRDARDFSEQERLILNLIGSHIAQACKNAESYAQAQQAFVALERSSQPLKTYGLTSREGDVLYWVAQGKTNREVARILNIAPGTVKLHMERTYQKLGVENRTTAARLVMETIGVSTK